MSKKTPLLDEVLKYKKEEKSEKGKGCFQWDKRAGFTRTLTGSCLLPTDFPLIVQSKIEQSKIKAEVSGLNNPSTSAFFLVFHSQFQHVYYTVYLLYNIQ